jgi:hypothetical protein
MHAVALALALLAAPADSASGPPPACPPVVAARLDAPVAVDGVLNEAVWANGSAVSEFKMGDPWEGAPPSQRTEVRVAYDDEALYVGARLYDTAPDSIIARLTRRDVAVPADEFCLYLDPYYDRRSGYYFIVNAAGTLLDGTMYNDGWNDDSWDGVWEGKVHRNEEGWNVEMRIPYSQLRFQNVNGEDTRWGINFRRAIRRRSEQVYLAYQPKKESGFVSRFPDLVGLRNIRPSRAIELRPYVTHKMEGLRHESGDPFRDGLNQVPDAGVDLRMAVGSNLTLNATINPDFGQVEVDPAIVNLSDVESFFEEKRPFFVENSSIFSFGQQGANNYWGFNWPQPTLFYSRRVGRSPQGSIPDADFVDAPVGTSILGAAKLTGKIAPSWNFGTLHALTAREHAELSIGGARSESEIEPLSYYGATRTLKEFKNRHHGVGVMTTLAARAFDADPLRDELNSTSLFTGVDGWTFLDKDQEWVISGWSGVSHVRGTETQMTNLQRSSRHYLQRPDAGHVEVDPDATSLTGWASRYWLNKQKGRTIFNGAIGAMSPKFDVGDVGFHTRTDVVNAHAGAGYKWTEVGKFKKYSDFIVAGFSNHDFQGNFTWGGVFGAGFTEFANNFSWEYRTAYNPPSINVRRTRGGPVTRNPSGFELGTYIDTDGKSKLFYFIDTGSYMRDDGGYDMWVNPGIELKPVSNFTLRVGPTYSRGIEKFMWIGAVDNPARPETFGRDYVFATLDQTEVGASIRLNYAVSPTLSLQCFVAPLISSGRYDGFKVLARSRSSEFAPIGSGVSTYDPITGEIDLDGAGSDDAFNPDFTVAALRGNAVLRWEYMPGSTVFLVWTQQRDEFVNDGDFNFGPSSRRLFDADMDNIFLAKVSYYFNL